MKSLRNNALSLVILGFFLFSFTFQTLAGWQVYNEERQQRHQSQISLISYFRTDHGEPSSFNRNLTPTAKNIPVPNLPNAAR